MGHSLRLRGTGISSQGSGRCCWLPTKESRQHLSVDMTCAGGGGGGTGGGWHCGP